MSRGDIITTARELHAMPLRTVVRTFGDENGSRVFQRSPGGWSTFGTGLVWSTTELWGPRPGDDGPFSVAVLYLPGETPRPERVVKAEALREAAALWGRGKDDWRQRVADWLDARARHVEAGEA